MDLDWILDTRELLIFLGVMMVLSFYRRTLLFLGDKMLKYLGMKHFDVCNLLSNNC